jgi:hypothetical protein
VARVRYIEVAQVDIFMEQQMRFGLYLGLLAILKKNGGANYDQLFRVFFSSFQGQILHRGLSIMTLMKSTLFFKLL